MNSKLITAWWILLQFISLKINSQTTAPQTFSVILSEFEILFSDISFVKDHNELAFDGDTIIPLVEFGEIIQGKTIQLLNSKLTNIRVEQQYETSMSISNEGPHLDLLDWKHHKSDWRELSDLGNHRFKIQLYRDSEKEKFPEFTEEELIDYLIEINQQGYSQLITNPTIPEGYKHWWTGLSVITIRISGFDSVNQLTTKYFIFEIPMGC